MFVPQKRKLSNLIYLFIQYSIMKKIFYLSVLALVFASCSVDNDANLLQEDAAQLNAFNEKMSVNTIGCLGFIYGTTEVDVSQGINNPKVVFIADVPNGPISSRTTSYNVHLEVQVLFDCENINSGAGFITRHSTTHLIPTLDPDPRIVLSPSQLPSSCYRWRFVVEGVRISSSGNTPCVTISDWYDETLF